MASPVSPQYVKCARSCFPSAAPDAVLIFTRLESSYSTRSADVNAAIESAFYADLVLFDTIAAQARGKAKLPGKWQNRFGEPEANPWSEW
jgi:hypothetical protein